MAPSCPVRSRRPATASTVWSAVKRLAPLLSVALVLATLFAGCAPVRGWLLPRPGIPKDWRGVLAEVRAYERTLGFRETKNFVRVADTTDEYTICGYAPRFELPYSYEDPLIRWSEATSDAACKADAKDSDYYFARIEAVGEVGVPVTTALLEGKLDRFLYLVIHEDCHDQFEFPYGFEEALCNLIAYQGMTAFSTRQYGRWSRTNFGIRAYAGTQTQLTRAVVSYYGYTERLYASHARGEMALMPGMQQRARLFASAERTLGWAKGAMNNVGLANEMTYSRHFPLVERVFDALDGDLVKLMDFFRQVDREKPSRERVLARLGLSDEKSVQAISAIETSTVDTTVRLLRGYNSASP